LNQAMATVTPGVVTESGMVRRPSEPGKPVSTPFQIPPAIYQFVGRKALLQEIETAVRKPTGSHIICLHGMAGVGKTATAVQIAYLMRQDFPDGVLWANIASSDPMSILDNWARAFGHNYTSLPDLENRAAAMRNALRDKKLLIILDDVDSKKQVDSLLPNNPGIAVILTTRLAELGPAVGAASFLITEMTPEDGRQLFAVIVGEGRVAAEPEAAAEICELVGYLPLAVKISGQRLVSRPRWALTAFANRLKNARSRLSELNILDEGVQASFDVSWELLTDELRLAFSDLAVFGARPFPIPAFAAVTENDEFTAGDRLDALVALSLLQEADRDIYRQHPLLADFSQNKLQDTGTFSRMVRYFLKFAQSHQKDYAALEARWDNIHYGLQIARQESDWQSVMAYADALADAWFALGRFDEARQGFGGAVAAAEAVDDQLAVGNYLYLNGRVCAKQHDYDTARANLEQSLNIHRALQNRPLEANDLFLLARIAMETGDYESALSLLAECRAIRQDERDELGLAETTFLEARIAFFRGDYEQCVALAQETIAPFRKFDNQSGLIRLLNVLASAEIEQKRFSQAEIHAREGLALADALQDKPEKAMMLYVLSNVARHQNDLTNAEVLIQESIALLQNMGDLVSLAGTLYQ
ncbi:MAG: tetratricopeptide repeat protein, partial [Anaerolineae bacterium]